MAQQHTPGPWKWIVNHATKSVELQSQQGMANTVMSFARWGMQGAQPLFNVGNILEDASTLSEVVPGREHHASWYQNLSHPDARLIAAAPDLLAAIHALLETGLNGGNNVRLAYLSAKQTGLSDEDLSRADKAEEALQMAYKAIAKAKGE